LNAMAAKSKFIIRRKDKPGELDDIVIESEGLTIGRLISNDLVLNHRTVSRTHAGIRQIGAEFWIFNLSTSNGTLLNGELVDKTALAEGDLIQIGPYLLRVSYQQGGLLITVELDLESFPVEVRAAMVQEGPAQPGEDSAATMVLTKVPRLPKEAKRQTGLLTSFLPVPDEQALKVFWEKRKRESGKIAELTPLHPRGERRVGKAQWNWRPTLDLRKLWRKSFFAWGALLVGAFSIAAAFAPEHTYSPGQLSLAHTSTQPRRQIAARPNASSCSECHSMSSMQQMCSECHTTRAFQPSIYKAHEREHIKCIDCHIEHVGQKSEAGLVTYSICSSCHNNSYRIKTGERAGQILGVPHGGTVGYPVKDGKWEWKGRTAQEWKRRGFSDAIANAWSKLLPKDQFHLIHQMGKLQGKVQCTDCHTAGINSEEGLRISPRNQCAKCHGVTFQEGKAQLVAANCRTCHQQHGQSEDIAKLIPAAGTDEQNIKAYLIKVATSSGDGAPPQVPQATDGAPQPTRHKIELARIDDDFGAMPWYGWVGLAAALPLIGLVAAAVDTLRRRSYLKTVKVEIKPEEETGATRLLDLEKIKAEAPPYPHPVVDPLLCIGCHACVEACPHDVLAIVNGIATPIAPDQCMEDTGCQRECPTSPKACIVINTTKEIPPREVPTRDKRFMTNVEGIYLIGDVSGTPLIKNAINEGGQVIDHIIEDIQREGRNPKADYDVAIIGVGPAGLSAAVVAKQKGLKYVAIEQEKIVATIQAYPAGKYVFYKPDTVQAKGGIPLPGPGDKKEKMLELWFDAVAKNGVVINEEESCKEVKREDGVFAVITEKSKTKERVTYKAQKVIVAVGNRGAPMKLRVPGEDLKMRIDPDPRLASSCSKCGGPRQPKQVFCPRCGHKFEPLEPRWDDKVKYRLADPDEYRGKKCIVVGAGNSAIEAAVDLCGLKREGDQITFTRDNEVTLVVRSDFKGDLKLGNKMNIYDCIDAGRVKVFFRTEIKQIREKEVVLMDSRTKEVRATIPNDYVFALIGGEKPIGFLKSMGIKIEGEKK
jgi:thioredoxin reductase (NADPH)